MLSLLAGLGKGYCCTVLPQIWPESKVLSSQTAFGPHTVRIANLLWCDIIACRSTPISPIWYLFCQNQHKIVSAGKQIIIVGRPEVLSQSLPSFRYRLSVVYQKSLNVLEQNCNVYWSRDGILHNSILLPQIRPEGKVLLPQIAFRAHTTSIANVSVA